MGKTEAFRQKEFREEWVWGTVPTLPSGNAREPTPLLYKP